MDRIKNEYIRRTAQIQFEVVEHVQWKDRGYMTEEEKFMVDKKMLRWCY